MLLPAPPPPPDSTSLAFKLIVLRIAMLELGRALEVRPQYAELAPIAFRYATAVADVTRLEALR